MYEPTSISVSVIMPCYNSEIYLPNLFQMFKDQTFKNYELIEGEKKKYSKSKIMPMNRNLEMEKVLKKVIK